MTRVRRLRSSVATGTLLLVAVLTTAWALGTASRADAALFYWPGSTGSYYQQYQPVQPPRRQKVRRTAPKKEETAKQGSANPQAPLIISVSIARQQVKIYDANGFYAEAPVSTGMPGHPTPMGVFSVIQKHRFHHSNIYSGAPMPYMQRITWSGVAMHAGVLPGYPASHGCIRMPSAFAVKMWNWTKLGARVFVTPGEIPTPAGFSHPLLPAFKVAPQPVGAGLPPIDSHAEAKADKGAPEIVHAEVKVGLRSTVGHNDRPVATEAAAPHDQTRTADAGETPATKIADAAGSVLAVTETKSEPKVLDVTKVVSKRDEAAASRDSKEKTADTKADQPVVAAKADGDDAKAEQPATSSVKAEAKSADAKLPTVKTETPKAEGAPRAVEAKPEPAKVEAVKPVEKVDDKAKVANDAPAKVDARKDQTRLTEKPAATKPEQAKRAGQIAVFISRKDSKLYVRQNFSPLFEVPITIAPSDRPFGTHVFTAEVDKNDANVLHWSVVSLPMSTRAMRGDEGQRVSSRRRKGAAPPLVEAKPAPVPDSPTEALDRITVPQDTMARIAETLGTGGSIILSDQGLNQGETGEGTDFIVSLR